MIEAAVDASVGEVTFLHKPLDDCNVEWLTAPEFALLAVRKSKLSRRISPAYRDPLATSKFRKRMPRVGHVRSAIGYYR